ncbi:pimeloyl-ACP methyl ester carboxylesterase [Sphingopyxis panaciterrae]|uniref:alpha/beta hydrolase family protein n=1 Tax=Sphingopyxis panaciterrae TaxID=363841 RepID=UPI001423FC77|nr:alpha/beta fold hydrolase [Sphingopyxis panaciterrae]NIJ37087.1 pimeloyl-ACP methyl ester carboxylesterase [Sphingopyxis panaciterrae]
MKIWFAAALAALPLPAVAAAPDIPAAIYTDPAADKAHPAAMEVVHIPSGDVAINGVVYVPAGAGPHPTVVLCHGLPGNEKSVDLAQAMRRAGWTVITFNYRGSWGSPGDYRFARNLEDADAVLAFARDPANAAKLRIDPKRLVIMGHSMGGWVTALTAAHDKALLGAAMISAGNMGWLGKLPREQAIKMLGNNGTEALAGTTPEIMADELIAGKDRFDFVKAAPELAATNLFILTSDDGLAPMSDALAKAIKADGGARLTTAHVATDHSWSDARIRLQTEILTWLATLKSAG